MQKERGNDNCHFSQAEKVNAREDSSYGEWRVNAYVSHLTNDECIPSIVAGLLGLESGEGSSR